MGSHLNSAPYWGLLLIFGNYSKVERTGVVNVLEGSLKGC